MASTRSILKSHYKARQEVTWGLIHSLALNTRLRSRTICGLAFSVPSEIQGLVAPAGYLRFDAQVFRGKNLFYFIIKWKVFFKNAKIHSKLAASRILGSGFCSWASILRGIFVAVWPPVLFLSPVPQVSHPFPTVAHPSTLCHKQVLFGTISNLFAAFMGIKLKYR